MSRRPRRRCLALAAFLLVFLWAAWFTGCDLEMMWSRRDHLTDIVSQMFPPDWSFTAKASAIACSAIAGGEYAGTRITDILHFFAVSMSMLFTPAQRIKISLTLQSASALIISFPASDATNRHTQSYPRASLTV